MKSVFNHILAIGFAFFMISTPGPIFLQAQSIIENPSAPLSADAGRVVVLKEVQRITDQEGKFFFEKPFDIHAGKDGSIYVQEYKQFLKFDPSGKFVRNLLRWGQGPGELNDNLNSVLVTNDEIILYSGNIHKALRMDLQGRAIEMKIFPISFSNIVAYRKGVYFFTQNETNIELFYRKSGIKEKDYRLVKVDGSGTIIPTPTLLPLTCSVRRGDGYGGYSDITHLYHVQADERYVFLAYTPEYLVKMLDLETGEIVRSFRRQYKRVPYLWPKIGAKVYPNDPRPKAEEPKYHNDICRLLMRGDKLWVVTSTFDARKGVLIDVYDRNGKYLDNFYLPLLNIIKVNPSYFVRMVISKDFLYVLEYDEDELASVAKYEIHGA